MMNDKQNVSENPNAILNGTYAVGTQWSRMSYSFDGVKTATINSSTVGHTYYTLKGSYQINQKGDEITLSFPVPNGVPMGEKVQKSETYAFFKEKSYISIGGLRYELVTEKSSETEK